MTDYKETELEDSLRRAFVDHRAEYIILDDRRQRFLFASAALGVQRGWLSEQFIEHDEQSSELQYRLTSAGREHFGLRRQS